MEKSALVVIAPGYEDIETVCAIDVLTRVGAEITLSSAHKGPVAGAWGTTLLVEHGWGESNQLHDAIVVPGGMKNAVSLAAQNEVIDLLLAHHKAGRIVASICASPSHVLAEAADMLGGRLAAGDPLFDERLAACGAVLSGSPVAIDGNIITATGPGSALLFSLAVARELGYAEKAGELACKWGVDWSAIRRR